MKRSNQFIFYGIIIFISPLYFYFFIPANDISNLLLLLNGGLILIITGIFESKKYQNKLLYFLSITLILILTPILTYFYTLFPFYKGNIQNYISVGIFMIAFIPLFYEESVRIKRYQESIFIYDKELRINPKNTVALNNKGATLAKNKFNQEALECFEKVLEFDPNDAAAWHNKGVIFDNFKNHKKAIRYYDKALIIDPTFETAKKLGKIILEN